MISDNSIEYEGLQKKDYICQVGDTFCQKPTPVDLNKTNLFNPIMADFERDMKDSLLGKVMENFENTMKIETKKLDDMKRESEKKQSCIEKDRNSQHIPSALKNEGTKTRELWHRVNRLIVGLPSENEETTRTNDMENLSPEVIQMLLSHGIGAWLSTLSDHHYENVSRHIYSETSQWISKIWRFRYSASLFHNKLYDGILSVCKVALATHFPKYQSEGYNALFCHPPVIYLNSSVDHSLINLLKTNLGLPSDCINLVPNNFELGSDESMDTVSLEQLILADISLGKVPLVIYTYAGSPNTDSMDQLTDIYELCKIHRIWLHIEGSRLSELALLHVPAKVNTISSKVKSLTLDIGKYLGIPSVPFITLVVSHLSESYMHNLGYGAGYFSHNRTALDIFPLWLSLQLIGHDGIINKIENQIRQNHSLVKRLKRISNIKHICRRSQDSERSANPEHSIVNTEPIGNISSVMDNVLTFMLDGHQIPFVIVFRYEPDIQIDGQSDIDKGPYNVSNGFDHSSESDSDSQPYLSVMAGGNYESQIYINSLNYWLADNLVANYLQMNITTINLPSEGICIRLCLHENNIGQIINEDLLEKFAQSVTEYVAIMNATVHQRILFRQIIKTKRQIVHLNIQDWAGLGFVLFIPEIFRNDLFNCSADHSCELSFDCKKFTDILSIPDHVNEINKINKRLNDELRNCDGAFSLGLFDFTIDVSSGTSNTEPVSLICIRFGLITEMTTIEHLINLVVNKGDEVETSTRNLEKLSILVKEGINQVNEQLAKEQEVKIQEQGVLRQLPYIDSIVNWMYPPDKSQIKGRSLNLSSGEIKHTDDTYKYKMQLQACSPSMDDLCKEGGDRDADLS